MWGVLVGEPISSSGLAMKTSRSKGDQTADSTASSAPTPPSVRSAASACRPARSPPFMSVTPGPYARPSSMRNGRAAAVPASKTVSR